MTSVKEFKDSQNYAPLIQRTAQKDASEHFTHAITAIANGVQMGFAEAYIKGFEIPDATVRWLLNSTMPIVFRFPFLITFDDKLAKEGDDITEDAEHLMQVQYDRPQAMLNTMIGESPLLYPKYTMALWERGAESLEQAQIDMLEDVIEKTGIQDGDTILDLGCGWGSAANYILYKFPNAKVTALNLSHEQCEYMRQKMQDPESYLSSGRFDLYEIDFKDFRVDQKFDKIIAIGFFEHVANLTKAFEVLAEHLQDNGKVFIHIITNRTPNNGFSPFLNKYIFPNARIWHYEEIPYHNQHLKTEQQWYLNGRNYSKTLAQWLKNFDAHQDSFKQLEYGIPYDRFRRIWRLYLIWCMAYFDSSKGEILGNGQYLLTHA